MLRVAVSGIAGRMGSRIGQILSETSGVVLAGGFERPGHPLVGKDLSFAVGGEPRGVIIGSSIEEVLSAAEVVIDFTSAEASLANLRAASRAGVPMVIGSTGWKPEGLAEARELAGRVPVVIAPNMSRGVNVLFKVVADVARLLGEDFDIEVLEAHHRMKKDAPSGTALRLAEAAAKALGRDLSAVGVYERRGLTGERTKDEIGLQTLRGGDIVGEHMVLFAGMGERIELIHRAHSRDNFARGAVHAAKWVVAQPPGLYDMQDVLGIK